MCDHEYFVVVTLSGHTQKSWSPEKSSNVTTVTTRDHENEARGHSKTSNQQGLHENVTTVTTILYKTYKNIIRQTYSTIRICVYA